MKKLMVMLAVVALMFAGCGGDDDDESPVQGGEPAVSIPGKTNAHGTVEAEDGMEVELDDFYFNPTFIYAKPGQKVTVELHNEGGNKHTFTSPDLDLDEVLDPDISREFTITAPASGTVVFYCRFHQSQGMQGAVVVR